ncbi:MAG: ornithine carbamoyltransferase [Candidatus Dormibacteria bacterium]
MASGLLAGRDLLSLADLSREEILAVIDLAQRMKSGEDRSRPLEGRSLGLLMQKPSNRTRVSFEVGIRQLGGTVITLNAQDIQVGERESIADVARVFDRYLDAVVARLNRHADLVEMARWSSRPVINALTDRSHPCQALADLLTLREAGLSLDSLSLAYVGDGNNVLNSLVFAQARLGFDLRVVTPPGFEPLPEILARAAEVSAGGPGPRITNNLADGVVGADAVYTDVWTSMGQEAEEDVRRRAFRPYQVNTELMAAAPGAIFLHCLPAHRGEEVTDEVIEGPQSLVLDQAENRLHAQKALLAHIFG